MLDPRIIRERHDEIVHSCRIRNVKADVEAVLTEQEQTNALLTELNEANRARNTHQKSGQRKMDEAEREAHGEPHEVARDRARAARAGAERAARAGRPARAGAHRALLAPLRRAAVPVRREPRQQV